MKKTDWKKVAPWIGMLVLTLVGAYFLIQQRSQRTPSRDISYSELLAQIDEDLPTARRALESEDIEESATLWRQIFGDKFPKPSASSRASFPPVAVRPNKPAGFA